MLLTGSDVAHPLFEIMQSRAGSDLMAVLRLKHGHMYTGWIIPGVTYSARRLKAGGETGTLARVCSAHFNHQLKIVCIKLWSGKGRGVCWAADTHLHTNLLQAHFYFICVCVCVCLHVVLVSRFAAMHLWKNHLWIKVQECVCGGVSVCVKLQLLILQHLSWTKARIQFEYWTVWTRGSWNGFSPGVLRLASRSYTSVLWSAAELDTCCCRKFRSIRV